MGNIYNKENNDRVNSGFEDDFDFMLGSLFRVEEAQTAKDETPTPVPVSDESSSTALLSLMISELDCPVCLQPMLGPLHLPLLCPNGHACCSSCSSRVKRICPICRSSNIRWTRCLTLERVGELLLEKGHLTQPDPPDHPQEDLVNANVQERSKSPSEWLDILSSLIFKVPVIIWVLVRGI